MVLMFDPLIKIVYNFLCNPARCEQSEKQEKKLNYSRLNQNLYFFFVNKIQFNWTYPMNRNVVFNFIDDI